MQVPDYFESFFFWAYVLFCVFIIIHSILRFWTVKINAKILDQLTFSAFEDPYYVHIIQMPEKPERRSFLLLLAPKFKTVDPDLGSVT